ncbi:MULTISPECIES: HdeD family acid-resistance protein [unclassified Streptococcus]|uniref:HdeD family acid-resistance protein n=1 Tax=unclassified Streptococcus TaxID=2608887 RepID=UPI001072D261|nr:MULTISPECIES: DUF308 domain-containing protein [unclassified Streptococcus]MBF0805615.1 DUF308 domain-containing protein [Streptococcus sp. 19428wA2_WM07]TFU28910.1 hypothetical protein E4T71_02150 [Streptococcus sp. WM07]
MLKRYAWLLLVVGILSLLAGFWVVAHPGMALAGIGIAVAIFFLIDGISNVVQYFANEYKSGWSLFNGVITTLLAMMLLTDGFGARTAFMTYMIAFWVLFSGITRFMLSFDVKKVNRSTGSTLMWTGILGIITGTLMMMTPFFTAVMISYMVGFTFIYQGIASIVLYFKTK